MLTLKGEVVTDINTDPRMVNFGELTPGEKGVQEFSLKVTEPEKVKVTSVTSEDERFKVKLKSGHPAGDAVYEVQFAGEKTKGRLTGNIKVAYTGSDVAEADVRIRGRVVGNLRAPTSFFILKRGDGFPPKELEIIHRKGATVKVLSAKDPDGHLKITTAKKEKDRVTLKAEVIDPNRAEYADAVSGNVIVKTDDKDDPELTIRYRIATEKRTSRLRKRMSDSSKSDPKKAALLKKLSEKKIEKEKKE